MSEHIPMRSNAHTVTYDCQLINLDTEAYTAGDAHEVLMLRTRIADTDALIHALKRRIIQLSVKNDARRHRLDQIDGKYAKRARVRRERARRQEAAANLRALFRDIIACNTCRHVHTKGPCSQ